MEGHLTGRVALVTGANCGIGAATAIELAARGASVLLTYLRASGSADENAPSAYGAARARDAAWVAEAIRAGERALLRCRPTNPPAGGSRSAHRGRRRCLTPAS